MSDPARADAPPTLMTRARATERRLRDRYPAILRAAGLDEETVADLMAGYDDPVVRTTMPLSDEALRRLEEKEPDPPISLEDFGPLP